MNKERVIEQYISLCCAYRRACLAGDKKEKARLDALLQEVEAHIPPTPALDALKEEKEKPTTPNVHALHRSLSPATKADIEGVWQAISQLESKADALQDQVHRLESRKAGILTLEAKDEGRPE